MTAAAGRTGPARPGAARHGGRPGADGAAKRAFDVVLAGAGLVAALPVLAAAAAGIRLSSPGPVLYRAPRVGRGGAPFIMYKLRTMHAGAGGSRITAGRDPRVFALGRLLRRGKVDELPQLLNILRGEMSVVGPRAEDPGIVARYYADAHHETLAARPGLTSPGTLYYYTHGEDALGTDDTEAHYARELLPFKLALDTVYVRHASVAYDVRLVLRTIAVIAGRVAGRRRFAPPPEAEPARALVHPVRGAP